MAQYLTEKGHTIIEKNWRCGHLEIDLITLDKFGLHFVEVKTRQQGSPFSPRESVGAAKQKNITKAALRFLGTKGRNIGQVEAFFDVASVILDDGSPQIEYIPNAFIPLMY